LKKILKVFKVNFKINLYFFPINYQIIKIIIIAKNILKYKKLIAVRKKKRVILTKRNLKETVLFNIQTGGTTKISVCYLFIPYVGSNPTLSNLDLVFIE
jgi:hypothetical protein